MASAQTDAIPPQDRERTTDARGVLVASLVGALMLLIFCARELPPWADQKWPELSDAAKSIDDTLSAAGLAAPYEAIHGFMQRLADDKFGGAR
jgi:hypothetical protein